jgi:hypothetical protein
MPTSAKAAPRGPLPALRYLLAVVPTLGLSRKEVKGDRRLIRRSKGATLAEIAGFPHLLRNLRPSVTQELWGPVCHTSYAASGLESFSAFPSSPQPQKLALTRAAISRNAILRYFFLFIGPERIQKWAFFGP